MILRWTPWEAAKAYRLSVFDAGSGKLLTRSEPLREPSYALLPSIAADHGLAVSLEIQEQKSEAWQPAGPRARVPNPVSGVRTSMLTWGGVAPVHRLTVLDRTTARVLLDEAVLGTSYPFPWPVEEQAHDLVMRVRAWRGDAWDEGTEWRPLPLEITLGDRRDRAPPVTEQTPPGLAMLFTVDTEGSVARQRNPDPERTIDELVLGDYGTGKPHGIGLQMDLLEHFGHRGCFFVDILMEYEYGQEALERTIEAIVSRGHELQLHVHASHLAWSPDPAHRSLAAALSADDDRFRRVIELSVDLFERRTGSTPLAYRAGAYRIYDGHFRALEEAGIPIDSSLMVYLNAGVSEWMKTRTQPFRVGGVLEVPVTWTMLRDDRSDPGTRSFAPNSTGAGDPVTGMDADPAGVPRVATYVSHSFELMQPDEDSSPEAIAAYEQRLRSKVPPQIADRYMRFARTRMRLYDGQLNDARVASLAGVLRRVADRPDARCLTYAELHQLARRFWSGERHDPVDPVPVLDRRHGEVAVSGTRVYSDGLLSHLASAVSESARSDSEELTAGEISEALGRTEGRFALIAPEGSSLEEAMRRSGIGDLEAIPEPAAERRREFDAVIWPLGLESCAPVRLKARFDAAAAMLKPEGLLLLRVETLGVSRAARARGAPALAELLFPTEVLGAGAADDGGERTGVVAWDASTFAAWFTGQGFELLRERRLPRDAAEAAAIARFPDKLSALAPEEVNVGVAEFVLRRLRRGRDRVRGRAQQQTRGQAPVTAALLRRFGVVAPGDSVLHIRSAERGRIGALPEPDDGHVLAIDPASLLDSSPEPEGFDVIVAEGLFETTAPESLADACEAIYASMRRGGQLLVGLTVEPGPTASNTTVLVNLIRAGLEVVETDAGPEVLSCRLIRPLDFADIARFATGS